MSMPRCWSVPALVIPSLEKFVQHMVVTYALVANVAGIRDTLAVDAGFLAVSGLVVGLLFAVAGVALAQGRRWAAGGLLALALFDVVGEFVAQGTFEVRITLSLVAAAAIVLLLALGRRGLVGAAGMESAPVRRPPDSP